MNKVIGNKQTFAVEIDILSFEPWVWGKTSLFICGNRIGYFDRENSLGPFFTGMRRIGKYYKDFTILFIFIFFIQCGLGNEEKLNTIDSGKNIYYLSCLGCHNLFKAPFPEETTLKKMALIDSAVLVDKISFLSTDSVHVKYFNCMSKTDVERLVVFIKSYQPPQFPAP